jgi:hypothetical protein
MVTEEIEDLRQSGEAQKQNDLMDIQGVTDLIHIQGEVVRLEEITLELQKNITPEKQSNPHPISVNTSVMHIKRKRTKAPIVVSEVRG